MQPRNLLILGLVFSSILLMGSGAYFIADNLATPKGFLFEGIVLFALGSILLVLMTAISYLMKVVTIFSDIYTKQLEMQHEMSQFYSKSMMANKPRTIGDILGLGPNSITVTNMETGETSTQDLSKGQDPLSKINEVIQNALSGRKPATSKKLEDMTIEQLEKELATAVKNDNFEKANEIKELIHQKRNPNSGESAN